VLTTAAACNRSTNTRTGCLKAQLLPPVGLYNAPWQLQQQQLELLLPLVLLQQQQQQQQVVVPAHHISCRPQRLALPQAQQEQQQEQQQRQLRLLSAAVKKGRAYGS